jgi:hypothetical protein
MKMFNQIFKKSINEIYKITMARGLDFFFEFENFHFIHEHPKNSDRGTDVG